jgi:hypothetical protein
MIGNSASLHCRAILPYPASLRVGTAAFPFKGLGGWVWADMAIGDEPDHYIEELGGDEPKVTHWAPWPVVVGLEAAT